MSIIGDALDAIPPEAVDAAGRLVPLLARAIAAGTYTEEELRELLTANRQRINDAADDALERINKPRSPR